VRGLLLCNDYDADPGLIGEAFRAHGYAFAECHRERPQEWPELAGIDLVLMLGSDWSVFWDNIAGEVRAEAELLTAAVAGGRPVFGICYGAQMIAQTFGGRVERAAASEVGWFDISSNDPAVIPEGPWFEWHYDHIATLPPGAVELARSPLAVQAFGFGRVLATQFHPEVDSSIVERWARGGGETELRTLGIDRDQLIAETRRAVEASRPQATQLVDWFCATVAAAPNALT
jgi:GMP synthase-like glutamine amidotransferase